MRGTESASCWLPHHPSLVPIGCWALPPYTLCLYLCLHSHHHSLHPKDGGSSKILVSYRNTTWYYNLEVLDLNVFSMFSIVSFVKCQVHYSASAMILYDFEKKITSPDTLFPHSQLSLQFSSCACVHMCN